MGYGRIERRFQERRNRGCSGILFDFLVEFDDFMENGYLWILGNVKEKRNHNRSAAEMDGLKIKSLRQMDADER